jgi:hypothetical protein
MDHTFCHVDFKITGDDRGCYYDETARCLIYLHHHESLSDLYMTIQHEILHFCLDKFGVDEMDDEQEEKLIFHMAWAEEILA